MYELIATLPEDAREARTALAEIAREDAERRAWTALLCIGPDTDHVSTRTGIDDVAKMMEPETTTSTPGPTETATAGPGQAPRPAVPALDATDPIEIDVRKVKIEQPQQHPAHPREIPPAKPQDKAGEEEARSTERQVEMIDTTPRVTGRLDWLDEPQAQRPQRPTERPETTTKWQMVSVEEYAREVGKARIPTEQTRAREQARADDAADEEIGDQITAALGASPPPAEPTKDETPQSDSGRAIRTRTQRQRQRDQQIPPEEWAKVAEEREAHKALTEELRRHSEEAAALVLVRESQLDTDATPLPFHGAVLGPETRARAAVQLHNTVLEASLPDDPRRQHLQKQERQSWLRDASRAFKKWWKGEARDRTLGKLADALWPTHWREWPSVREKYRKAAHGRFWDARREAERPTPPTGPSRPDRSQDPPRER